MTKIIAALSGLCLVASVASTSQAEAYALKAAAMRALPLPGAKAVDGVDANQIVSVTETNCVGTGNSVLAALAKTSSPPCDLGHR